MIRPGKTCFVLLLPVVIWAMTRLGILASPVYAASSPSLGTAASYSVIAGSAVTNTGATTISGDVGISPGTTPPNYTGFGTVTLGGTIHDADTQADSAQLDRGTAYGALAVQGCDTDYGAVTTDLAGKNLVPGVYCSDAFLLTGTLTLNGGPTDVWIFKAASSLTTTGSTANVVFTGSGNACNVWWYVPSTASLDAGSSLVGTIIADTSVTFASGASLDGRAFAHTADVTLDGNSITGPTCNIPASGSSSGSGSDQSSGSVLGIAVCTASDIKTIPTIIETKRVSPTSIFASWGPYEGIDSFVVEYGTIEGKWDYNTKVTGFSTTLNDLPANQPIWIHVAATDSCAIGPYSATTEGGGSPGMPNTGFTPKPSFPWLPVLSLGFIVSAGMYVLTQTKRLVSLKR